MKQHEATISYVKICFIIQLKQPFFLWLFGVPGCSWEFEISSQKYPPLLEVRNGKLGGGFKHFLFSPLPGEMIQFDEHIFQMGWFNHQLKKVEKGRFSLRYATALDWQQFTLVISIISERGARLASGDHVVYSLSDAAKHSCNPNAVCETLTEDLCFETFVWGCLV